jgi:hypothetical protein
MISWAWLLFCATFSGRNFQVAGILSDAERPHHGHFVSCVDQAKTRENETNLSPSEMKRFAVQVLTR